MRRVGYNMHEMHFPVLSKDLSRHARCANARLAEVDRDHDAPWQGNEIRPNREHWNASQTHDRPQQVANDHAMHNAVPSQANDDETGAQLSRMIDDRLDRWLIGDFELPPHITRHRSHLFLQQLSGFVTILRTQ
jgi:hypothetical protein